MLQAFFEGNPFKTVPGPFKLFYRCMRSKPGYHFPQCHVFLFPVVVSLDILFSEDIVNYLKS